MTSHKSRQFPLIQQRPAIRKLAENADHIDIKTITSEVSMREFIANMFSYMPGWMRFLYGVRWFFVRLLGMKQEGIPQAERMAPEDVSFEVGQSTTFFQVVEAEEDQHWFAAASEAHLTAHLGLITEPLTGQTKRFHFVTLVQYHKWTGSLYFNVIRPFHHLVVKQMMKAAVQTI